MKTLLRKNEIMRFVWIKFRAQWRVGTNEKISIAGINVIIDRLWRMILVMFGNSSFPMTEFANNFAFLTFDPGLYPKCVISLSKLVKWSVGNEIVQFISSCFWNWDLFPKHNCEMFTTDALIYYPIALRITNCTLKPRCHALWRSYRMTHTIWLISYLSETLTSSLIEIFITTGLDIFFASICNCIIQ